MRAAEPCRPTRGHRRVDLAPVWPPGAASCRNRISADTHLMCLCPPSPAARLAHDQPPQPHLPGALPLPRASRVPCLVMCSDYFGPRRPIPDWLPRATFGVVIPRARSARPIHASPSIHQCVWLLWGYSGASFGRGVTRATSLCVAVVGLFAASPMFGGRHQHRSVIGLWRSVCR